MTTPAPTKAAPRARRALAAALLAATMLAGVGGAHLAEAQQAAAPAARPLVADPGYADLVEAVAPAVVMISAEVVRPGGPDALPPGFPRFPGMPAPGPQQGRSLGSGFVVDPDGYVVTNHHVIAQGRDIRVTLSDGRSFDAEVVGSDERTDVALLKVSADAPLPHVEFADSDAVRVGDRVLAVGNPFGLGGTVTSGIVSALGRDIRNGPYDEFLQIDAAINRGNSGGPAFDVYGRVVGINTAIFSPSGGSVGIGFAIPANQARAVIDQLREKGFVERGWIGVSIRPVTEETAPGLGLREPVGVLVEQVVRGGPAMRAGIVPGDVIVAVDGTEFRGSRDFVRAVADRAPGSELRVTLWRDGRERTATLEIGTDERAARAVRASLR
jgi:serine protease Do